MIRVLGSIVNGDSVKTIISVKIQLGIGGYSFPREWFVIEEGGGSDHSGVVRAKRFLWNKNRSV